MKDSQYSMQSSGLQLQLNILDYALSSLWRHKLKNSGVFLVFTLVIFLLASFQLLTSSLTQSAAELLTTVPDITIQQLSAGRQIPIALDQVKKLDRIFGIEKITPRIWGYYFDEKNGANYTVMGMAIQPDDSLASLELEEGYFPTENSRSSVVLGQAVLKNLGLGERRHFSLYKPDLTLVSFERTGVFNKADNLLTNDLILMSLTDAGNLFAMQPDTATDLMVQVYNSSEIPTIAEKISEAIPGSRVLTGDQIHKTYQAIFGWRSGFGSACLLSGLLAFVILAWDKGLGFSPEEQREVGILKMLGWQTGDIMKLRFYESLAIALLAFLLGVTLAWLHMLFFNGSLFRPIFLGWSVLRPSLELQTVIHGSDLILIFSLSVLPYLAATVVPAWRSAIVKPDSVI